MHRKIGLLAIAMMTAVSAGSLFAQQDTTQKPAAKAEVQHPAVAKAAKPAHKMVHKATAAKPKWTKEQITEIQDGLAKAKLFNAKANGHLGPQTRRAIRAFERANKLPVTGTPSDTLMTLLKAQGGQQ
jgi:peptidoglycan hydrolase-like protein with peptidoglycan-binding domain